MNFFYLSTKSVSINLLLQTVKLIRNQQIYCIIYSSRAHAEDDSNLKREILLPLKIANKMLHIGDNIVYIANYLEELILVRTI